MRTDSGMADSRGALAVAHEGVIHVGEGTRGLSRPEFDLLLAHERVHVAQQARVEGPVASVGELEDEARRLAPEVAAGRAPGPVLRAPRRSHLHQDPEPRPVPIPDDRAAQGALIDLVNQRLHEKYGVDVENPERLTRRRVHMLPARGLERRMRRSDIENMLLRLFTGGNRSLIVWNILSRADLTGSVPEEEMRAFIRRRLRAGFFEYQQDVDHPLQTFWRGGIHRITPAELAIQHVSGYTRGSRRQGARRVFVEMPGTADTLVHEACHFYTSNAFTAFADANAGRSVRTQDLGPVLREGFTEYFTRELVRAYPEDFGTSERSYQREYETTLFLVATLGEREAIAAYFGGDAAALARLGAVVSMYEGGVSPTVSFSESAVPTPQPAPTP